MMRVTRGGDSLAGLILVLALHFAVLFALLQERSRPLNGQAVRHSDLLLILPPPQPPVIVTPPQVRVSAPIKPAPSAKPGVKIRPEPAIITAVPEQAEIPEAVETLNPPDANARLNIEDLVRQAGKADRETRPVNEIRTYGPTRDSIEAIMSKAFTEAKLAVPLKWYEAARIELFSAPNDPKKIYQVKTAFGTYCLFYPSIYEEVGGGAAARQPKVSSCPRRFGRGAR